MDTIALSQILGRTSELLQLVSRISAKFEGSKNLECPVKGIRIFLYLFFFVVFFGFHFFFNSKYFELAQVRVVGSILARPSGVWLFLGDFFLFANVFECSLDVFEC
jgi:hypothetical protein